MNCTQTCHWNERTFESWSQFYNETSKHMFCDCVRAHPCCGRILENRFAKVKQHQLTYLQLFGDIKVKGNWRLGDSDVLRQPHSVYKPLFSGSIAENVPLLVRNPDKIIWNLGHHACHKPKILQVQREVETLANQSIFLRTIGLRPCLFQPNHTDIIDSQLGWSKHDFWDGTIHLKGQGNWNLAVKVLKHIGIT